MNAFFGSYLTRFIPLGTKIQAMAWELANPHVTEYITIAVTKPDNQRHWIVPTFRGRISLADTIVLVHRLGFVHAGEIVAIPRGGNDGRACVKKVHSERRRQGN